MERESIVMDIQGLLRKLADFLFTPRYHPERHYMRGPGPACRRAVAVTARRR